MTLGANKQEIVGFLNRFQQDPNSISQEEAMQRFEELVVNAPPDVAAEAGEYAFGELPPEARAQFAHFFQDAHNNPQTAFDGFEYDSMDDAATPQHLGVMSARAGRQDPGLLGNILRSPLGRMLLAAAAAYVANKLLGGEQAQQSQGRTGRRRGQAENTGGGLGPLGGLLGGAGLGSLLGGLLGGGAQGGLGGLLGGGQPSGMPQQGGGLADVLAGALGGQNQQSPGGQPGNLGDLLGGAMGGQGQGMPQGGLGDLLGGLLGGQQGGQGGLGPLGGLLGSLLGGTQGGQGGGLADILAGMGGQGGQGYPSGQSGVQGGQINPAELLGQLQSQGVDVGALLSQLQSQGVNLNDLLSQLQGGQGSQGFSRGDDADSAGAEISYPEDRK
jgi:hypothetical protein